MPLDPDLCEAIRSWAEANRWVSEVRLFGSRAKGTHRPDSDIDLALTLVESPTYTVATLWMFDVPEWQEKLTEHLGVTIDLRVYNLAPDSLIPGYCTEAGDQIIYARAE